MRGSNVMCKILVHNQKGISLLLMTLILSVVMAISVGLSSIIITELKISTDVDKSSRAYYAAESGIEEALYLLRKERRAPESLSGSGELGNGASFSYTVSVDAEGKVAIVSTGSYGGVKRSVEARY